jgi:dihydroflavonol-4-reductase
LPAEVNVIYGDILHPESFFQLGRGIDILVHLAAMITFDPHKIADLMEVNGKGTANVLDAARSWGVNRSIVVSSACTLGVADYGHQVLDENNLPAAEMIAKNPYMASKIAAENEVARRVSDQFIIVVNPTTVYGAGDWRLNSGTLVKRIAGSELLPVPPGGSNVVDIDDVVEGIMKAISNGKRGEKYILGGVNMTFSQIFSEIALVTGKRPFFVPLPRWTRLPMAMAASVLGRFMDGRFITSQIIDDMFKYKFYSIQKAGSELLWEPKIEFTRSIENAWKFYAENGLV